MVLANNNSPITFIIIVAVIAVVVSVLILFYKKLRRSGKLGERKVSKKLNKLAKKFGGYVIDDVIIPNGSATAQIDHVYISPKAIFVIETKDYSGRIYGNENQKQWTQVLAYGHEKHKLYNPAMQNQTHVNALKKLINFPGDFYSYVVFVRGDVSRVICSNIYYVGSMYRAAKYVIKHTTQEIDYEKYYSFIQKYKDNPIQTTEEHVKEINHRTSLIEDNYCPYCGVPLVLKYSDKTKRAFYGCPNYPKCKYIKNK